MIEILFELFCRCWVIVIAFSIPIVIACLLAAPTEKEEFNNESHYYGERPSGGHDDRRQGLRTDAEQDAGRDAGKDAFDHSWLP